MRSLLYLRVNLTIVFLGALAVLFLIRLTALLPTKYYFSFSKLVAGESGPFLVDPPSVSGRKLCNLLRKNGIPAEQLEASQVNCELNRAVGAGAGARATTKPGQAFDRAATDQIYGIALRADPQLRSEIARALGQLRLLPMPPADLEKILAESKAVATAYKKITEYYTSQIDRSLVQRIGNAVGRLYEPVPSRSEAPQVGESRPKLPPLDEARKQRIRIAHAAIANVLGKGFSGARIPEITKTEIDGILGRAYGKWDLSSGITAHYGDPIKAVVTATAKRAFANQNLVLVSTKEARKRVFRAIAEEGIAGYVIVVLIRLAPVLLFAGVLGYIFGRNEFLSISVAAGLAAFLLSWPLMLLWDRLVQGNWADQKSLFMAFYAVYIVSFFVTARVGAILGALVRTKLVGRGTALVQSGDGGLEAELVTWREFAKSFATGALVNGLVYAWNIIIPLTVA